LTDQSFPQIGHAGDTLQLAGTFLGYTYRIRMDISRTVEKQLQAVLNQRRDIGKCIGPVFLADWAFHHLAPGTSKVAHMSEVVLYQDGGSWGEQDEQGHWEGMGVLFCRKDTNLASGNPPVWRIHVPDASHQDTLLDACGYAYTYDHTGNAHLDVLKKYVQAIINDQSAWELLSDAFAQLDSNQEREKTPQEVLQAAQRGLWKLDQEELRGELGPGIMTALRNGLELLIARQEHLLSPKTIYIVALTRTALDTIMIYVVTAVDKETALELVKKARSEEEIDTMLWLARGEVIQLTNGVQFDEPLLLFTLGKRLMSEEDTPLS
jgi:hypothetical protein